MNLLENQQLQANGRQEKIHRTITVKRGKAEYTVPRILEPADKTIHLREEGPTVQVCGDSAVAGEVDRWSIRFGKELQRNSWPISEDVTPTAEKKNRTSYLEDR